LEILRGETMKKKQDQESRRRSILRDTRGLTTVEYIIILCLIAIVAFGVWKKFGEKVKEKVGGATEQVDELPTQTEE
jgi:Flp pilus assembly pilin Flp